MRRHLVFWMLWWIYFTASYYHYRTIRFTKNRIRALEFSFFYKVNIATLHSYNCLLLFHKLPNATIPVQGEIHCPGNANHYFRFSDSLIKLFYP